MSRSPNCQSPSRARFLSGRLVARSNYHLSRYPCRCRCLTRTARNIWWAHLPLSICPGFAFSFQSCIFPWYSGFRNICLRRLKVSTVWWNLWSQVPKKRLGFRQIWSEWTEIGRCIELINWNRGEISVHIKTAWKETYWLFYQICLNVWHQRRKCAKLFMRRFWLETQKGIQLTRSMILFFPYNLAAGSLAILI